METETTSTSRYRYLSRRGVLQSIAVVGGAASLGGLGSAAAGDDQYQRIPKGTKVQLEKVADGLTHPLGFEVAPEDTDRRFILDQTGEIYIHDQNGLQEEPFLDITDSLVELGDPRVGGYDERGLLGLAFHPDFQNNRKFYVRYSAPNREGTPETYDHTEVLSEFRATEDLSRGNPDSERPLLEIPSPQLNHNSGEILFGPDDGYLYMGMGDGGAAGDVGDGHVPDWYDENEGGNAQDVKQNLLGGILRIDVDGGDENADPVTGGTGPNDDADGRDEQTGTETVGGNEGPYDDGSGGEENADAGGEDGDGNKPYAIPDDNPLVGTEGRDEYYAWGLRNPWRMSFNNGRLFVGDLGQNLFEEVNIVEKGGNYGWNVREGTHGFNTQNMLEPAEDRPTRTYPSVRGGEKLIDPIIEYAHSGTTETVIDGNAVIGGYVYGTKSDEKGVGCDAMSALQGKYVFGNWSRKGFTDPEGVLFAATPPEEDGDGAKRPEDAAQSAKEGGDESEIADGQAHDQQLWSLEELQIADKENNELDEFVMSLGRDHDGELYVMTAEDPDVEGDTGKVYKIAGAEKASRTENPSNPTDYTWKDATLDAYWYSFFNLDVVVFFSANGVLAPESGVVTEEQFRKRQRQMLEMADIQEPPVENTNLNVAPFTKGSAKYTQPPVFAPKPHATTLAWDKTRSSKVVSPASVAWTQLKSVLWAKNLQNHLGVLPGTDTTKFNIMTFGTLAQLAIKYALMDGKLRQNDEDMRLVSEYRPEDDEVVDETPKPMHHSAMLWFLSNMTSLAQNGWYGYENPEPLIPVEKIQQLTDQMAKTTMDEFSPDKIMDMGSTRDLGEMLGAITWYATHSGDEQYQQQATEYANSLADAVSENMGENGKIDNGAENQAATQGIITQGLLWASQIDGVDHEDMAESALEYMLELWDDEAGTFASGMDDSTYTITATDAADVTGGLNAAEAVLDREDLQPIFAEYFNNTFKRGRLQRAQLRPSYDRGRGYLIPLPADAGGKYGQSPAYNTEVEYDTEADEWQVTDDTYTTAQAQYLANQDIWISNWGGGFYNGRGIPGQTDKPMVVIEGDKIMLTENVNSEENIADNETK